MSKKTPKKHPTRRRKTGAKKPVSVNAKVKKAGVDISTVGAAEPAPSLAALIGQKEGHVQWNAVRVQRTIAWPASVWQHIKQDWFPTWAKLRWPPVMQECHYWEECPEDGQTATVASTTTGGSSYTFTVKADPDTTLSYGGVGPAVKIEDEKSDTRSWAQKGWDDCGRELCIPPEGPSNSSRCYMLGWDARMDGRSRPE